MQLEIVQHQTRKLFQGEVSESEFPQELGGGILGSLN